MSYRKNIKHMHDLPDTWLTSRAIEWLLHTIKTSWWIMSFTADGTPVSASYKNGVRGVGDSDEGKDLYGKASKLKAWHPDVDKQQFAKEVCEYLNLSNNGGGAWMAGWVDLTVEQAFYLLWKNFDGDIMLDCEFPQSWEELQQWDRDSFVNMGSTMLQTYNETLLHLNLTKDQQKLVAAI
jgi:hypothetical protein